MVDIRQSMSATPESEAMSAAEDAAAVAERRYRAIHGMAVSSVVLGVLSVLTALDWWFAPIPIAGITLAWLALRRIRRNAEELTGLGFAKWGLSLSLAVWLAGSICQVYLYYTSAPPGYRRVYFKQLQPAADEGEVRVPLAAEQWDNMRVFVKGYMSRPRHPSGLREFVLVDDPGACGYCAPTPKLTQRILVRLNGSFRTDFTTYPIGVGGVFSIHKDPKEEGMRGLVYLIEADVIR